MKRRKRWVEICRPQYLLCVLFLLNALVGIYIYRRMLLPTCCARLQPNMSFLFAKHTTRLMTASTEIKRWYSSNIGQYLDLHYMNELVSEREEFVFTITPWKINSEIPRNSALNVSSTDIQYRMAVFVKSKSSNLLQRKIARWTWAGFEFIDGFRIEAIFIIGRADNEDLQEKIRQENITHGDLLQLDQDEVYTDVINKTLAGMEYAHFYFPSDWIYASSDDDVMPDIILIQDKIKEMIETTNGTIGQTKQSNCTFKNQLPVLCGFGYNVIPKPRRSNESKWRLDYTEYPLPLFPPYCNGGWYAMPVKLAKEFSMLSKRRKPLWIDDVWITGLLRLKHFANLASDCFLNDTTIGLWTANSQYLSFSKTGSDNKLMTKWAQYAAKIYQRKYIHAGGS